MRAFGLLLATMLHSAAGYTEVQWMDFTHKVKSYVNNATKGDQLAISMAWVDEHHNYTYQAGLVNETNGKRRPPTAQDTYLYGSGSKVTTSVAVLSLVERGVVGLDDPVTKHVDRLLGLYANTSLVQLWGPRAINVTVRECLHMSSGIMDYDNPIFDDWTLINDSAGVVSPVLFISYPLIAKLKNPFYCDPGTCRAYSSTGFVLLGLLLTEHSGQDDWTKVTQMQFYHPDVRARFEDDLHFFTDEPLLKWLTVPGLATTYDIVNGSFKGFGPSVTVAEQNSSIVGFTCANSVTNPLTMAQFQYALLHEQSVLKASSMKEMQAFEMLDAGWGKGMLAYGLGLIKATVSYNARSFDDWGGYIGHGGMVFGFISQQAYYWGLNATISVAFNTDGRLQGHQDDNVLSCQIVEAAANILHNAGVDFDCRKQM